MENVSDERFTETQNKFYVQNRFFPKILTFMR